MFLKVLPESVMMRELGYREFVLAEHGRRIDVA
jgi:hypothetical protein